MSFKVILRGGGSKVIFEASSPVSESASVNYDDFNIVHLPTNIWAFRNSTGRHFSISGKLVSRSVSEANTNASYLNIVRAWKSPDFGNSGATPPIIFLSAYNNKNLTNVPCILRSYSWVYPDEVDYIFTSNEPMPVIGNLNIDLDEAYSPQQITAGNWKIKLSNQSNNIISFIDTSTIDFSSLDESFQGLAAGDLTRFPSIGNSLVDFNNPDSIYKNPSSTESNSMEITESTKQISQVSQNPYITGITSSQQVQASIPLSSGQVVSNNDPFGRSSNLPVENFIED